MSRVAVQSEAPAHVAAVAREQSCPYCRAGISADARKCRFCGEWVVRASPGAAAALLRLVGWLWVVLSALGALGLWRVASAARARLMGTYVDESFVAPRVVDVLAYAGVGVLLLQGLTIGLGLVVFAGLAPRRPR